MTPPASTQVIEPSDHATIVRSTQAPTAISNANNPALNSSLCSGGRRVSQTTERAPMIRTATASRMSRNTNAYSEGTSESEKLMASRRCSRWNTARSATPNAPRRRAPARGAAPHVPCRQGQDIAATPRRGARSPRTTTRAQATCSSRAIGHAVRKWRTGPFGTTPACTGVPSSGCGPRCAGQRVPSSGCRSSGCGPGTSVPEGAGQQSRSNGFRQRVPVQRVPSGGRSEGAGPDESVQRVPVSGCRSNVCGPTGAGQRVPVHAESVSGCPSLKPVQRVPSTRQPVQRVPVHGCPPMVCRARWSHR